MLCTFRFMHVVIFAQDTPCYADKNMDTAPAWAAPDAVLHSAPFLNATPSMSRAVCTNKTIHASAFSKVNSAGR